MTIVISAKTSEGLVLGADSLVAENITLENGQSFITNTFENAKKLFQLEDYPIGVLVWGMGHIGNRNIGSLIDEFGNRLVGFANNESYKLREISQQIFEFIKDRYSASGNSGRLGILIGGYSAGEFFPEEYVFELPESTDILEIRPKDQNGNPTFGVNWYGLADGIIRFHWGYEDNLKSELINKLGQAGVDISVITEIDQLFFKYQYPLNIDIMPIQDVIDYVNYLINIMIGRYRFYRGVALCGGEVDIAVITYKGFNWVKTKKWKV